MARYFIGNVKRRKVLKLNERRIRLKFGFKLQKIATVITINLI